jgi:ATP-dependent NAD(P)H-hydrate dehydratase
MLCGRSFKNLKRESVKGTNGTILIIGGSEIYTGAPIFAAKAALRSGSDLAFILCSELAVIPIKSLHEAAVSIFRYDERILNKVTAAVVGPGLGIIDSDQLQIILKNIEYLNARKIPIVIDADAIHYYKLGYFNFVSNLVITPNYKERINLEVQEHHICIFKDENDIISYSKMQYIVFNAGSKKRCGGQGDMLSGILATALSLNKENPVDACISACELVRAAASMAFEENGFSLVTSDIIEQIPAALKLFL